MIYLASPYYHELPRIRQWRYEEVLKKTAELLKEGYKVFSPIVHSHLLHVEHNLPTEFEFWMEYDLNILRRCDALWILMLDGVTESKGIAEELKVATSCRMPVEYVTPSE